MKQDSDLETILGYQLQRAYMLMSDDARRVLEPHGLTPAKLTALLLIRSNPGCDQTALGRALNINRSSTMKLVNVLATQGVIERRAGRNLRTNALHVLPAGHARLNTVLELLRESEVRITTRLSQAEHATLSALLRKLSHARSRPVAAPAVHDV